MYDLGDTVAITKPEVMALLLDACPSFERRWDEFLVSELTDVESLSSALGELAHHLVGLLRSGATGEFPAVFDMVERMHSEGTTEVKEAATIGLLEGLQNISGDGGAAFVPFLGPATTACWNELNRFWNGEPGGS